MHRFSRALVAASGVLAVSLGLAACVTTSAPGESQRRATGVEPALVVERFLQAANVVAQSAGGTARDLSDVSSELQTMARLFGTRKGPIHTLYPRTEVEQRMVMLASILQHRDYRLEGEALVPGRVDEAVRVMVRVQSRETDVSVPFTLVRSASHGWLIEQFDAERITSSR